MKWAWLGVVGACVAGAPASEPKAPAPVAPVAAPRPEPEADPGFALHRHFPRLRARFPRAVIGAWPTPVDTLTELAAELGVERILVKRDDLSAEPYGGSKPRKLELLFGATLAAGKKSVVTMGGVGSHHAVATALYAKQLGLEAHLLFMPEPPTEDTRDVLLSCLLAGARMELVGTTAGASRRAREIFDAAPGEVDILPAGGSSALGNLGFVSAGLELADQIHAGALAEPNVIYLALGTMGSAVGLAIGLEAAGLSTEVVAVRAASSPSSQPHELQKMFSETVELLRNADPSFPEVGAERLHIENRYLGEGYAVPTPAGTNATELAARHGVALDATYTAKAFAAFVDAARSGKHRRLLFWHTHAAQALDPRGVAPSDLPAALRTYAGK